MAKEVWDEAIDCAAYLLNRCPTRNVWNKTPLEAWSGIKPGISHLRVFGTIAYAHVPDQKRSKLDDKSAKDVEFDEKASWDWNIPEEVYDFFPLFDDEEREHRGVRQP
ncbi:hypothetical protein MRB53_013731 [Persea americana]|uniref:Uncharacterized protein n=1 Tax=Persea americana TaxID=3435 RepID=A0ACC2K8T8_PERAE|nr:hypothetical protein MRB53_013731 [Persea americana]